MRFATMLLATFLASSLVATPIADACGGYGSIQLPPPRVAKVSTHGEHTFVVLDTKAREDGLRWRQAWPRSFDATKFATRAPLAKLQTFTLVGPSGTRVIKTARSVVVRPMFVDEARDGFQIALGQREEFAIALEGEDKSASWHALSYTYEDGRDWLAKHHVSLDDITHASVQNLPTLGLGLVSFTAAGEGQVAVRQGNTYVRHFYGSALGALETTRGTYLVLEHGGQISLAELPLINNSKKRS